jgi:hypothetical protein
VRGGVPFPDLFGGPGGVAEGSHFACDYCPLVAAVSRDEGEDKFVLLNYGGCTSGVHSLLSAIFSL